jgi:DNA-directed RNA polymerase subunit beta'
MQTTVGRGLLSEILPEEVPFELINKTLGKKQMAQLVNMTFRICGPKRTVLLADALRSMGYRYSTKAGLSICINDMVIPAGKQKLLGERLRRSEEDQGAVLRRSLTEGERYNKVIDIWAKVTENIAERHVQQHFAHGSQGPQGSDQARSRAPTRFS